VAAADPTSREMIERLVAFDTTSRKSNLALIHFVRDCLADLGVDSLLVRPAGCIVGEPTEMKVVTAHKGKRSRR
jgi:hypothetical protein